MPIVIEDDEPSVQAMPRGLRVPGPVPSSLQAETQRLFTEARTGLEKDFPGIEFGSPQQDFTLGGGAQTAAVSDVPDFQLGGIEPVQPAPPAEQEPTDNTYWSDLFTQWGAAGKSIKSGTRRMVFDEMDFQQRADAKRAEVLTPELVARARAESKNILDMPEIQRAAQEAGFDPRRGDLFIGRDAYKFINMPAAERQQYIQGKITSADAARDTSQDAADEAKIAATMRELYRPEYATLGDWDPRALAFDALASAPYLGAAIAVSIPFGPEAGAASLFALTAPDSYNEGRDIGLPRAQAQAYAGMMALAEALPETRVLTAALPVSAIKSRAFLRDAVTETLLASKGRKALDVATAEAISEIITSGLQDSIRAGAFDQDVAVAEAIRNMARSGAVGFLAGGTVGAAVPSGHTTPAPQQREGGPQGGPPGIARPPIAPPEPPSEDDFGASAARMDDANAYDMRARGFRQTPSTARPAPQAPTPAPLQPDPSQPPRQPAAQTSTSRLFQEPTPTGADTPRGETQLLRPAALGTELPPHQRLLTDDPEVGERIIKHYKQIGGPVGQITRYSKEGKSFTKAPSVRIRSMDGHDVEVVPTDGHTDTGAPFTVNAAELEHFELGLSYAQKRLAEMYFHQPTRAQAVALIKEWNWRFPAARITHGKLFKMRKQIAKKRLTRQYKRGNPLTALRSSVPDTPESAPGIYWRPILAGLEAMGLSLLSLGNPGGGLADMTSWSPHQLLLDDIPELANKIARPLQAGIGITGLWPLIESTKDTIDAVKDAKLFDKQARLEGSYEGRLWLKEQARQERAEKKLAGAKKEALEYTDAEKKALDHQRASGALEHQPGDELEASLPDVKERVPAERDDDDDTPKRRGRKYDWRK